jgi:hypothetical protein
MSAYANAERTLKEKGGNQILLQNRLRYEFNEIQVTQVIDQMKNDNFISINNQVNYHNCTGIASLNQTLYPVNLTAVQNIFAHVMIGYKDKREDLRKSIKAAIKEGMVLTLSTDVLSPVLNHAGHYFYENIKKFFKDSVKKFKENQLKNKNREKKLTTISPEKKEDKREAYEEGHNSKNKKSPSKTNQQNAKTSKGKRVYDEPIGPVDPIAGAYADGSKKIDQLKVPEADKISAKEQLYKALREYSSLSTENQEKLLQAYQGEDKVAGSAWKEFLKFIPFYPTEAQAVVPAVLAYEVLGAAAEGISACIANPLCVQAIRNGIAVVYDVIQLNNIANTIANDRQEQDYQALLKKQHSNAEQKLDVKISGSSGTGMPDPNDWEPDNNDERVKKSNFEKGDYIDLKRFTNRFEKTKLKDPETGQYIQQDNAVNSGITHGGSYWKLYSRDKKRIGTLAKDGKFLRE